MRIRHTKKRLQNREIETGNRSKQENRNKKSRIEEVKQYQ